MVPFELTFKQFYDLTQEDCHYCGLPAKDSNVTTAYKNSMAPFRYNGLDRVVCSLGYVLGNVVACCKYCNRAKNDLTYEAFLDLCERVTENHRSRNRASK